MQSRYLEHPAVTHTLRTGYPVQVDFPRCPICGEETDTLFFDRHGEVFGCDNCVTTQDAWEVEA